MRVVLVHHGDVVEDLLVFGIHAPQPVVEDHHQLVGVAGVVGDAARHHREHQVAVPVLRRSPSPLSVVRPEVPPRRKPRVRMSPAAQTKSPTRW